MSRAIEAGEVAVVVVVAGDNNPSDLDNLRKGLANPDPGIDLVVEGR